MNTGFNKNIYTMKQKLSLAFITLLFFGLFFSSCSEESVLNADKSAEVTVDKKVSTGRVADPAFKFDESKFDDVNWPVMREWKKAGTTIPWYSSTPIIQTISPTNSAGLQAAIDAVSAAGGGQLRLSNGTYTIDNTVFIKSNVRVNGSSKTSTILKITMRSSTGAVAIDFNASLNAGMDNLTIQYDGEGSTPVPNNFTNAYPNYKVTSVNFPNNTKNCWLQGVRIINSGSNAISSWRAQNITIRDCYIDGAFNKGDGGSGYVGISASKYFLMYNNTVKNIRHVAIQKIDCAYNVLYKNTFTVDVNFHDGDYGNNLVEGNTITLPQSHWWSCLQSGSASSGHKGPGPGNIIWANNCFNPDAIPTNNFTSPTLYWLTVGEDTNFNFYSSDTNYSGAASYIKPLPPGNTFYPVIE